MAEAMHTSLIFTGSTARTRSVSDAEPPFQEALKRMNPAERFSGAVMTKTEELASDVSDAASHPSGRSREKDTPFTGFPVVLVNATVTSDFPPGAKEVRRVTLRGYLLYRADAMLF